MRITSFRAKGYRSLRDLEIRDFGAFNIFYGPNGAGKSNILSALEALFAIVEARTRPGDLGLGHRDTPWPELSRFIGQRDLCHLGRFADITLAAELRWEPGTITPEVKGESINSLEVEIVCNPSRKTVQFTKLRTGPLDVFPSPFTGDATLGAAALDVFPALDVFLGVSASERGPVLQSFVHKVAKNAFCLVGADRIPRPERADSDSKDIAALLYKGKFKEALLRAGKHPEPRIRGRYKELGEILAGEPLRRPRFEMTEDPETGRIELVETLAASSYEPRDIPLDLAGLGIVQIYQIMARALLGGTDAVAIEEPEAHLHAPTSGIQLRQLLERLVEEHYIDQLFIATHSNLFDLDPAGYYDVAFDPDRGTQVVRNTDLIEIDKKHLYEPGPAKHALLGFLRYMDRGQVVFRQEDGTPVSAGEMLDMLQRDDPLALEFLRDVTGAAVRGPGMRQGRGVLCGV